MLGCIKRQLGGRDDLRLEKWGQRRVNRDPTEQPVLWKVNANNVADSLGMTPRG